ncbi:hypothetical protein THTE_1326 [Thermogutta terrifontis]|uniref:Uncharacterized protein n=1 Tax=Thermogutta terrifontis TaxID=1331910 RepID=A0A286RD88_9BACT|nr:hypothetical protein THTE_1326 [Thermogutta terrifontis]
MLISLTVSGSAGGLIGGVARIGRDDGVRALGPGSRASDHNG